MNWNNCKINERNDSQYFDDYYFCHIVQISRVIVMYISMDSCMMFVFFFLNWLENFCESTCFWWLCSENCCLFLQKKYNYKMKKQFLFLNWNFFGFLTFSCVAYYPAVQFIFPKYFCYYIIKKKKKKNNSKTVDKKKMIFVFIL